MSFSEELAPPTPPRGMGTGLKVILAILAVSGLCMLVCCGAGGFFGWKAYKSIVTEPAQVQAIRESMVGLDVLPGFEPAMGADFRVMKFAVYADKARNGFLLFMAAQQAQMNDLDQHLGEGGPRRKNLRIVKAEAREFEVKGQKVKFNFEDGIDTQTNTKYKQVSGSFPGSAGATALILQMPAENFDEDAFQKMIESIR